MLVLEVDTIVSFKSGFYEVRFKVTYILPILFVIRHRLVQCTEHILHIEFEVTDRITDRREILRDVTVVSRTCLLPFWWRYL